MQLMEVVVHNTGVVVVEEHMVNMEKVKTVKMEKARVKERPRIYR